VTAREALEEWLDEARDPDDEQRAWKQAWADGMLLAYERAGALSAAEIADWRERFADAEQNPARDDESFGGGGGWTAYGPIVEDEEAGDDDDEGWGDRPQTWPRCTRVVRVAIGAPERADDLAIVALVVHEDAVAVHFHWLGPPEGEDDDEDRDAFDEAVESLVAPSLTDDRGTRYEPVMQRPMSAHGSGGDPERLQAIGGAWLYTPAAPGEARVFTAGAGGHTWELHGDI
jgi:hypothetical protein